MAPAGEAITLFYNNWKTDAPLKGAVAVQLQLINHFHQEQGLGVTRALVFQEK